jgi:beta-catenin-like protein 1
MPLSQVPALAYPEIVKTGTITMLVGLLSHENMDIVIDVVEVIRELTDEDVGGEADEEEEAEVDDETGQNKKDLGMKLLIDALVCHNLVFAFSLPLVDFHVSS